LTADLSGLPEARILAMMARHLQQRVEYPVGSQLWREAVVGYGECKRELDRRLLEYIVQATAERDAGEAG
jgi:hypothetical protein